MHFAERLTFIFLTLLASLIGAVVGGTMLWLIWEDSLTAMFPSAVSAGILAAKLTWWQSTKIVWVFATLLKTTVEVTRNVVKVVPIQGFRVTKDHKPGDHTTGI